MGSAPGIPSHRHPPDRKCSGRPPRIYGKGRAAQPDCPVKEPDMPPRPLPKPVIPSAALAVAPNVALAVAAVAFAVAASTSMAFAQIGGRALLHHRTGRARTGGLQPELPGLPRLDARQWRVRRPAAQGRLFPQPLGGRQRRGFDRLCQGPDAAGSSGPPVRPDLYRSRRLLAEQQRLCARQPRIAFRRRGPAER